MTFGLFWKHNISDKNCVGNFLGNFRKKLGYFICSASGHTGCSLQPLYNIGHLTSHHSNEDKFISSLSADFLTDDRTSPEALDPDSNRNASRKIKTNCTQSRWSIRDGMANNHLAETAVAIVQWIRLRLPSCRPRFDSLSLLSMLLSFIVKFVLYLSLQCEKRIKKEAGFGHFFKKTII